MGKRARVRRMEIVGLPLSSTSSRQDPGGSLKHFDITVHYGFRRLSTTRKNCCSRFWHTSKHGAATKCSPRQTSTMQEQYGSCVPKFGRGPLSRRIQHDPRTKPPLMNPHIAHPTRTLRYPPPGAISRSRSHSLSA